MAIFTLAGLAAATPAMLAAAPYVLKGGAYGLRKFKQWKDPEGFRRQQILKQAGATPEQYELRKQNLSEALGAMQRPQQVFLPRQAQMQQGGDITAGLPQEIGRPAQPARPGSLTEVLNAMNQGARTGYQEDLAGIGARRGPVRNPLGRTSGQLGMMSDALRGRATNLARNRFQLLADFANRNAMSEMEAGGVNLQRGGAQNQLQNFLQQMRQQQQGGIQAQYLGQQGMNVDEANLRNILEGERYQQGIRQFRIGQQEPYTAQPAPQVQGV